MKRIFFCFILAAGILPALSQEKAATEADKVAQNVYTEVVLEDFESSQYNNSNIKFTKTKDQEASLSIRDEYAAEFNNSKKYLGVKIYAKKGDNFQIFPAKPLEIKKYCKSINIWVYGKKFAGELSIMVQDVNGTNHRLRVDNTTFLGWKKLTVDIPPQVKQQHDYLEKDKSLKLLHIQYRAANRTIHPIWQYFYIDDITATVRDKYKDRQSDDW